jgi:hypothetical protein
MDEVPEKGDSRLRRNWIVIGGIAVTTLGVLALQAFLNAHFSAVDEYDDDPDPDPAPAPTRLDRHRHHAT